MAHTINLSEHIRPILGAIRSVPVPTKLGQTPPEPIVPFVTISRDVGAGAWNLAQQLCDALNQAGPPGSDLTWSCWDRELVEKVAADHHLSQRLIDSLEERHSWLSDFFDSFILEGDPAAADEMTVFSKVALTVRALAKAGRVVLVGRGAVFLTHGMPGGIHIRLDAPLEYRVRHMMEQFNLNHDQAAKRLRELSKRRLAFFHRYWPGRPITPELFTVTINTAAVSPETSVEMIESLVRDVQLPKTHVPAPPKAAETSGRR